MQCPRCLNSDPEFFYKGSRGWYCRKCITFGRAMLQEEKEALSLSPIQSGSEEYTLQYPLTSKQKEISFACKQLIEESDVLLHCVCGAGKTELVVETISAYLKKRKKVCFAIPRRQVVLELRERLASYFPNAKVIAVCGGYTEILDGDLIICTTHQLYRYYQTFDLLILDEPDAYPFRGNPVLHGISETCCKGHTIYLTATPDKTLLARIKKNTLQCLTLNVRPHGRALPVPKICIKTHLGMFYTLLRFLKNHQKEKTIVFVPTIQMANTLGKILGIFFASFICTSKTVNRDEMIERYRRRKNGVMVATTVLERGVTIPGVHVCVYYAEHPVFDLSSLIQMAGRVGRSYESPYGEVLFLQNEKHQQTDECVRMLREANLECDV